MNCGTAAMSTERFVELAKSQGVAAEVSNYLPDEFICVHSGMQVKMSSLCMQHHNLHPSREIVNA